MSAKLVDTIANRLKEAMKDKGNMSQAELAREKRASGSIPYFLWLSVRPRAAFFIKQKTGQRKIPCPIVFYIMPRSLSTATMIPAP